MLFSILPADLIESVRAMAVAEQADKEVRWSLAMLVIATLDDGQRSSYRGQKPISSSDPGLPVLMR